MNPTPEEKCMHEYHDYTAVNFRGCVKCGKTEGLAETIRQPSPSPEARVDWDNEKVAGEILEVVGEHLPSYTFGVGETMRIIKAIKPILAAFEKGEERVKWLTEAMDNYDSRLTVHLLRNWDNEKRVRFCLHILGDKFQAAFEKGREAR